MRSFQIRCWIVAGGLLLSAGILLAVFYPLVREELVKRESLVGHGAGSYSTIGRRVYYRYAFDDCRHMRVVLIDETFDQEGQVELKSNAELRIRYPPDPTASGLYVDGTKWPLLPGLHVYYTSTHQKCTLISLTPSEAENVAGTLESWGTDDWRDFVEYSVIGSR